MGTLKACLLGGGFVLFALALRQLNGTADTLPIGRFGAELLPPYHAAKLLADPVGQSWRFLPWTVLAIVLLGTNIALLSQNTPTQSRISSHQPLLRLLSKISGRGPRLGIAEFVAISMWRSAGFRARVLPLLGLPAGMVFLTLGGEDGSNDFVLVCLLLQLPAIYLPFLIAFLPRADQANTGWIFAHAPELSRELVSDATWRALTTHVLVPTYGLALVLVTSFGPDRFDRAAAATFAFGIAVIAARLMTRMDRVPFTENREEDRGLELGGLMTGALALGLIGTLFGSVLTPALRWPMALIALAIAGWQLSRHPRKDLNLAVASTDQEEPCEAEPTEGTQVATSHPDPASAPPTIRAELRAVLVLFAVLSVLPWLVGAVFAP